MFEIHNAIETSGYVSKSPKSDYIVLDTARIDRNGLFYIYNLLIKPKDITSGYNPNGLATVDISGFVSENDADNYAESSLMFNYIARKEEKLYNQHCQINDKRIKMFKKITSEMRSDEK